MLATRRSLQAKHASHSLYIQRIGTRTKGLDNTGKPLLLEILCNATENRAFACPASMDNACPAMHCPCLNVRICFPAAVPLAAPLHQLSSSIAWAVQWGSVVAEVLLLLLSAVTMVHTHSYAVAAACACFPRRMLILAENCMDFHSTRYSCA